MRTNLSKSDLNSVLDIIHSSLQCRNSLEFKALLEPLSALIPFSHARCGFGDSKVFETKKMAEFKMLAEFPKVWEVRYAHKNYVLKDAVALAAYERKGLLYWSDCVRITGSDSPEALTIRDEAAGVGLKEGWIYSLQGRRSSECAIVSLGGASVTKDLRSQSILEYIGPHLGQMVKKIVLGQAGKPAMLTPREAEILSWAAAGKSAWETSEILKISRRTVEFHMGNILNKLDAVNAQQAIAIAFSSGLITY